MRARAKVGVVKHEADLADTVTFARLSRARDFLAAYYRERVTLEQAATQACLSPYHFSRMFTKVFGETPHEFVTGLRISYAKKLLLSENHSVTDICFEIGYESLGSFSIRFSSLTGLSPAQFRRRARSTFAGFAAHWPLYYIPGCYQRFFVGRL